MPEKIAQQEGASAEIPRLHETAPTSSQPREVAIQQKLVEYRAHGMDDHSLNIYRFRMEREYWQTQEQPARTGRRYGPIVIRR